MAIALEEPSANAIAIRLGNFSTLLSNLLLDAELRSVCVRDKSLLPEHGIGLINFVPIKRPISDEIDHVLAAGYLRGADCLHVATALYISPDPRQLTFLTLDVRQRAVAKKLGFKV